MNVITFDECRDHFELDDTFAGNNKIITEGEIEDLPRLKFRRHGAVGVPVENCKFFISPKSTGNIVIFVAASDAVVKIADHTRLNLDLRLWRSAKVVIGEYTTINQARMISDKSEVIVGRDCMFSDEILLQSSDQHGLIDLNTMKFTNNHHRRIELGDHVWIGRKSMIMPDVTIGSGCVVGAGSTVTKSVADCTYVVGVPAKVVTERSSWTRQPGKANDRETEFFEKMNAEANTVDGVASEI